MIVLYQCNVFLMKQILKKLVAFLNIHFFSNCIHWPNSILSNLKQKSCLGYQIAYLVHSSDCNFSCIINIKDIYRFYRRFKLGTGKSRLLGLAKRKLAMQHTKNLLYANILCSLTSK